MRAWVLLAASCIRNPADIPPRPEGGTVTGVVVEQNPTTGDVEGAAGATIRELATNRRLTADDRGFFQLDRLPIDRRVYIDIFRDAGAAFPKAARRLEPIRILVDGQAIDLGEIRLSENGGLAGRALLAQDGALPAGAGGTIIAVAQTAFKGVTELDGEFLIPSVPQGTFEVIAFRPGYRPARASGVPVSPSATVRVRDLVLEQGTPPPVSLSGEAYLAGAEDHSGVAAELVDELDPSIIAGAATTDAGGGYAIPDVPIGVYRVRFSKVAYAPVELAGVAVLEEGVIGLVQVTLQSMDAGGPPGDRDGDGCPDATDAFPDDPFGCFDTDGDTIADAIDTDDDGDGLSDFEELSTGVDGFVTDPLRPDTDGDGFPDVEDCPTVPNPTQDPLACRVEEMERPPPEITGFDPVSGVVGTTVTILGRNFFPGDRLNAVQFGTGEVVAPMSLVTADRMVVAVPPRARTGPLTVFTGGQVVTSTDTFTFISPPEILRVQPPAARIDGRFAVVGRELVAGEVFIGAVSAPMRSCNLGEVQLRDGEEAVCATVPNGAVTGRLEVRSPTRGASQDEVTFVVLSGPVVYEVRPNIAPRGSEVTITGEGFDTTDTMMQDVMVEFFGAQPVVPSRVLTRSIEVVVPNDATTGAVRVVHPSGDAVSPNPFIVDDNAPVLLSADHTLIETGDVLVLLGRNLAGATSVSFAGGMSAAPQSAAAGQVTVVVPSGVDPGPVMVTVPSGTITSPFDLAILERSTTTFDGMFILGFGTSANDQSLYAVDGMTRELVVADASALTLQSRAPLLGVSGALAYFGVSPSGNVGVLIGAAQTFVVLLPSGASLGTACPRGPSTAQADDRIFPVFDDQDRYAFVRRPSDAPPGDEGFLRIDLADGSCDYFSVGPVAANGSFAFTFDPVSRGLYVTHGVSGAGLVDVDPNSGILDGSFLVPFVTPAIRGRQLFRGLLGQRLYATGPTGLGVQGVDAFSGRAPESIATPVGLVHQTRSGRWLFVGDASSNGYFVDLLTESVARTEASVRADHAGAGGSAFFIDTMPGFGEEIRRFTIRD